MDLKCLVKWGTVKLVSHWHANFSRLFCEFCRGLAHDIRASVVRIFVSRTSRELVAKFFNMLKNFMRFFFSQIFRKTVVRRSRDVRTSVANLSPRNFGEFTMRNFCDTHTNVARRSRNSLAKTSRLSGEKIKLSDIRVARHSHECRATVVRI